MIGILLPGNGLLQLLKTALYPHKRSGNEIPNRAKQQEHREPGKECSQEARRIVGWSHVDDDLFGKQEIKGFISARYIC